MSISSFLLLSLIEGGLCRCQAGVNCEEVRRKTHFRRATAPMPRTTWHMANLAVPLAKIQCFWSVHPNLYSVYEPLGHMQELVPWNQSWEHIIAIED